jgi:hypothetical protein
MSNILYEAPHTQFSILQLYNTRGWLLFAAHKHFLSRAYDNLF